MAEGIVAGVGVGPLRSVDLWMFSYQADAARVWWLPGAAVAISASDQMV
jgi:hypothetical protein